MSVYAEMHKYLKAVWEQSHNTYHVNLRHGTTPYRSVFPAAPAVTVRGVCLTPTQQQQAVSKLLLSYEFYKRISCLSLG
jgi:hypothetical protein